MTDSDRPPSPDRLIALLRDGDHEETVACLDRLGMADVAARKRGLQALRERTEEGSRDFDGLASALSTYLADEDRSVRLVTAKLFVTLAESEPTVVLPVVDVLAGRLADDGEFYYVRARCAETLGYVALEFPEAIGDPEILAEFRIGLSLDAPEVKEKLAKALECVALGDPSRLRHQVPSLTDHLDDGSELVRYHLCTALAVIGCDHPGRLTDAHDALRKRLADEDPYVRGRAAEALGLLAESGVEVRATPGVDGMEVRDDEVPSFLTVRLRFLRRRLDGSASVAERAEAGTIESIRDGTDGVVDAITLPEGECPHCGLALPNDGPPVCPHCGTPH